MAFVYDKTKGNGPTRSYFVIDKRRPPDQRWIHVGESKRKAIDLCNKINGDHVNERIGLKVQKIEPATSLQTLKEAFDAWITRRQTITKEGQPLRRAWRQTQYLYTKHLLPRWGSRKLDQIDEEDLRGLIVALRPFYARVTVRCVLFALSGLYTDQPKRLHLVNPVSLLTDSDWADLGKRYDPKTTPYLHDLDQCRAVFEALPPLARDQPWRAIFAIGFLAGLRTGEQIAIHWSDVDFSAGLIHVKRSVNGPLKDEDSRIAPLPAGLAAVLKSWRKLCPVGSAPLFPAGPRQPDESIYVREKNYRAILTEARDAAKLPQEIEPERLTAYHMTRHTFASLWVLAGGSLYRLAQILGHSSSTITERYAHLDPSRFSKRERTAVDVDLTIPRLRPLQGSEVAGEEAKP